MDDTGRYISLDEALLPPGGSPLLPSQFIPNTGTNTLKVMGTLTGSITWSFPAYIGATTGNDTASTSFDLSSISDLPIAVVNAYDATGTSTFQIVNGALYKPFTLGYNAITYTNGSRVLCAWSILAVKKSVVNVILRRTCFVVAGDTVQAQSGTLSLVVYLIQRQDTQLLFS